MKKIIEKLRTAEDHISSLQYQSRKEDITNSIIHSIGIGLSITALVLLVFFVLDIDIYRTMLIL